MIRTVPARRYAWGNRIGAVIAAAPIPAAAPAGTYNSQTGECSWIDGFFNPTNATLPTATSPPCIPFRSSAAGAASTPAAAPAIAEAAVTTLPTQSQLSAEETPGNFYYTADLELVQNTMDQYGDTWDNAQAIVNGLYAGGVTPGTVTQAMALGALTGITAGSVATTTAASTAVLTDPSTWPWYYWAAGAAGAYFLLRKK